VPVSPTFRVELIEPLDEHGPYAESLARSGGRDHVHHIRVDVGEYAGARARLERLGVRVAAEEQFAGAPGETRMFRATYFDTGDELGFTLQSAVGPPGFVMPDPDAVYPPPG
jgi:Glyoxalase/Bleomycin resistance protein/Dioxygenase superfamily